MMIAEIILNSISRATDNIYHYEIPLSLSDDISVGVRVIVPFGFGNKTCEGYVIGIVKTSNYPNLKPIKKIIDNTSLFDKTMVEIVVFMRHRYFCTYAEAIKSVIPAGVNIKFKKIISLNCAPDDLILNATKNSLIAEEIVNVLKTNGSMALDRLCEELGRKNITSTINALNKKGIISIDEKEFDGVKDNMTTKVFLAIDTLEAYRLIDIMSKKAPARARVLEQLVENESMYLSDLLNICDTGHATVNALRNKGYIDFEEVVVMGDSFLPITETDNCVTLTDKQAEIIETIKKDISENKKETYLLYGITGSGKTQIYLSLIDECIKCGKQAIFLVPEISLTPQMVRQVASKFEGSVAVLHSMLTSRQRYDEWKKIKNGHVDVVVGARSAVFAPFSNLGLIIIDEEHENTYKSESSPRYDTKEIARLRTNKMGSVLLLASATPSVESFYKAKTGIFKLLTLEKRANNASLPDISIVDMRKELQKGNMSIFSSELKNLIDENIKSEKQTILFLNRRGHSNFVSCRNCGYVAQCPNCNISLTYHKSNSYLVCHYCDYKTDGLSICPKCGSEHVRYFGIGTQKVVDEIGKVFPSASVLRMDADATKGKQSHEKILSKFRDENINILVGTQMITKGLDFENVTLVGILAADMSLNIDDFRSDEKTFDLITQVSGRAGRGRYKGNAVIQTYDSENETIILSKNHDYISFYNKEIRLRNALNYPPFCEIINIVFSSHDDTVAFKTANAFYKRLTVKIGELDFSKLFNVFKVVKAPMYKVNNNFRYRFLIKTRYNKDAYNMLHDIAKEFYKDKFSSNIIIDVNPQSMN